jgi:hypothetical protein
MHVWGACVVKECFVLLVMNWMYEIDSAAISSIFTTETLLSILFHGRGNSLFLESFLKVLRWSSLRFLEGFPEAQKPTKH